MRNGNPKNTQKMYTCSFDKGIFILISRLTGPKAEDCQKNMADRMGRLVAGDPSLVEEIYKNAKSQLPTHAIAREALQVPVSTNAIETNDNGKRTYQMLEEMASELAKKCTEEAMALVKQHSVSVRRRENNDTKKLYAHEVNMKNKEIAGLQAVKEIELKIEETKGQNIEKEQAGQVQVEEAKKAAVLAMEEAKRLSLEKEKEKIDAEKEKLNAEKEVLALKLQLQQPPPPLTTMSRVAEKHKLLDDIPSRSDKNSIVTKAGTRGYHSVLKNLALTPKVRALYSENNENQYDASEEATMIKLIKEAKVEFLKSPVIPKPVNTIPPEWIKNHNK
jgi:hypothetical protein